MVIVFTLLNTVVTKYIIVLGAAQIGPGKILRRSNPNGTQYFTGCELGHFSVVENRGFQKISGS